LEELSRDFQNEALLNFCLGQAYFFSKNYDKAKEALQKSINLSLKVGLFPINLGQFYFYQFYTLGQCYLEKGDFRSAKEMFLKSLTMDNNIYKSYQALALISLREGNFKEAIEYYQKVLEIEKGSDQDYANLGLAYRKLGLFKEAEEALKKALEINPHRKEALTNLGYLYYENKDYLLAEQYFKRALDLSPNLKDTRFILSDIYFRSYDLDNLVNQCEPLLKDLNLSYDIIIIIFADLSRLYESIGNEFSKKAQRGLALLAFKNAILIYPREEVIEKAIKEATALEMMDKVTKDIKEILEYYKIRQTPIKPENYSINV